MTAQRGDDRRAGEGHFERVPDYEDAVARLIGVSLWIDEANAHRHPDTNLWSRVSKAAEEGGEAMDALRGFLGENPRKGQTCGIEDVVAELLDTAVSALGAIEHITGHDGTSFARLVEHIEYVHDRMQEAVQ